MIYRFAMSILAITLLHFQVYHVNIRNLLSVYLPKIPQDSIENWAIFYKFGWKFQEGAFIREGAFITENTVGLYKNMSLA